jgi:hypothetical protein
MLRVRRSAMSVMPGVKHDYFKCQKKHFSIRRFRVGTGVDSEKLLFITALQVGLFLGY